MIITSKNTSTGSVAAIFKSKIFADIVKSLRGEWKSIVTVLDYGCGKSPQKTEAAIDVTLDTLYDYYDPYWFEDKEPKRARYDIVVCANVLNVIPHTQDVITAVSDCLSRAGVAIFQIYEGDRSKQGRPTKKGYQHNLPTKYWFKWLRAIYGKGFIRKGNVIIWRKP